MRTVKETLRKDLDMMYLIRRKDEVLNIFLQLPAK
jgi:hypothetical protein